MTDVLAVVVTLRDNAAVRAAIASVRAATTRRDVRVVCVVNDPGATGTWLDDGITFVGAGMNLGWAGGMQAGVAAADGRYVWAIQDDMVVAPGSLDTLCDALAADEGLAAVRPMNVDAHGMVSREGLGGWVSPDGRWLGPLLAKPVRAHDLASPPTGDFLPSSGTLIRRDAWDEVGGFDPWFYPWGYIDIDFGRTLREAGWQFANVATAHMTHSAGGSTNSVFRQMTSTRNHALYRGKWTDADTGDDNPPPMVSRMIVETARAGRARPRDTSLPALQHVAGAAAADLVLAALRWMEADMAYPVAKALVRQPSTRRALSRDVRAAVRSRWPL